GSTQKFAANFERVDLRQLRSLFTLKGIEFTGRGRGRIAMAWPSGHIGDGLTGDGEITAAPPDGVPTARAELPVREPGQKTLLPQKARFSRDGIPAMGPLAVGGNVAFRFDPKGMTFDESTVATPATFVTMRGRVEYGSLAADFPFHVTSHDWQE